MAKRTLFSNLMDMSRSAEIEDQNRVTQEDIERYCDEYQISFLNFPEGEESPTYFEAYNGLAVFSDNHGSVKITLEEVLEWKNSQNAPQFRF